MADSHQILVGKIVAPQGLRGEVRVQTYTETPADLGRLAIVSSRFSGADMKFVRVHGHDTAIVKITGFDDRNAAESLRGTELFTDRDALPALSNDEYYQADLIGCAVIRDGKSIGLVVAVQNYGAGDILELDNGEMVSFPGAVVDLETRKITVAF